jgi:hypothetical protein
MTSIAADDLVTCAIFAKDNNLLDVPGWKRFKSIARGQHGQSSQAQVLPASAKIQVQIRNPAGLQACAIELDEIHGTTQWVDVASLEMVQLDGYDCFHDQGKGVDIPKGFKNICVHLIYEVQHDGRHKAQLVADGHLTDIPVDSAYSGVVTL